MSLIPLIVLPGIPVSNLCSMLLRDRGWNSVSIYLTTGEIDKNKNLVMEFIIRCGTWLVQFYFPMKNNFLCVGNSSFWSFWWAFTQRMFFEHDLSGLLLSFEKPTRNLAHHRQENICHSWCIVDVIKHSKADNPHCNSWPQWPVDTGYQQSNVFFFLNAIKSYRHVGLDQAKTENCSKSTGLVFFVLLAGPCK